MGSSRPHQSHSRQQITNVHTRPHAATPRAHDEPSPPYATPNGSYSTGAQYGASPVSRQGTPVAFPVGTSHLFVQLEQPASRVTPPPAAPVKAARNRNGGNSSGPKPATLASPVPGKSRRVRTGCLTCRERHLKCDERVPDCNNCRKSNRECRRGIRLNFIDVQVNDPPCVPPTTEWSVQILDESRSIASEYKGGLGRYARLVTPSPTADLNTLLGSRTGPPEFRGDTTSLPVIISSRGEPEMRDRHNPRDVGQPPPRGPTYEDSQQDPMRGNNPYLAAPSMTRPQLGDDRHSVQETGSHTHKFRDNHVSGIALSLTSPGVGPGPPLQSFRSGGYGGLNQLLGAPPRLVAPSSEGTAGKLDYLSTEEDIHFVQVFIEEVAVWMDSLDKDKHFANTVPYLALKSPMMLNALLACGARHLTLLGADEGEKAGNYYDMATTQLLRSRQGQHRSVTEDHAITAAVLSAYGVMSDKPTQRMEHIASARALICECGWDATSTGLGAACFWVNVGMEVLSCIAYGWHTACEPDQWGLDLEFTNSGGSRSGNGSVIGGEDYGRPSVERVGRRLPTMDNSSDFGDDEVWVHRMLYILAKVANFRASIPQSQEPFVHDEQVRRQSRSAEWMRLRNICNAWNVNCPRSMQTYGYSPGPSAKSLFPNVWLIKCSAKLARLFYHTAMYLLAQINPLDPPDSRNEKLQLHHAHQICGIVAHTRDRGVSSVAVRSIAVVSTVLVCHDEQDEVLDILGRISRETGWRLGNVVDELKGAWGWEGSGAASSSASNPNTLAPLSIAALPTGSNMRSGRGTGEREGRGGWT